MMPPVAERVSRGPHTNFSSIQPQPIVLFSLFKIFQSLNNNTTRKLQDSIIHSILSTPFLRNLNQLHLLVIGPWNT
ncbi:uncharacterized protein LY89DRAFT_688834 [Mollisia scopiformis]|uniref:Uncharacterized protein n=1 Tax=Mollisia scopiformis TaxID=149040 RepID=A0A194WVN8_MOLSC|nr:uncharacterized protein LY89DRAFT_688834 [Mollisia scopiformis]KUJ11652.1 hypothetical protein LY89DRAFT_688834 [Mollisia scopiformis]